MLRRDRASIGAGAVLPRSSSATTPREAAPREGRRRPRRRRRQFDRLVAQATEARKAEQWDEAIALYAKAVKLKPSYVEGYWYQGTAYYTLDKFTECRDAFRDASRGWRRRTARRTRFSASASSASRTTTASLQHLLQSRILGVGDTRISAASPAITPRS